MCGGLDALVTEQQRDRGDVYAFGSQSIALVWRSMCGVTRFAVSDGQLTAAVSAYLSDE